MNVTPIHSGAPQRLSVARRAIAFATGAPRKLVHRLAYWKSLKLPGSATETAQQSSSSRAGPAPKSALLDNFLSKGDRPGIPGGRRPGIVWFRSDLRLHDHEALSRATAECSSVLPVYCFDPRDYGRSSQGYDRTGPYRATFLLQAVSDLRDRLRAAGSDLVVRVGRPEEVVGELARRVGAAAVYCHSEVTFEEQQVEKRVKEAVRAAGAGLQSFWTNTLHNVEDLPFALAEMPQNFDKFKDGVSGIAARAALHTPERVPGLPLGSAATIDSGDLPTLKQLGLEPLSTPALPSDTCIGGESEALRQLRTFLAPQKQQQQQGATAGSKGLVLPGSARTSSFASSVAPWLATGCLSPRRMLEEAKAVLGGNNTPLPAAAGATEGGKCSGGGMQWIEFELLWRDFFRLLTRRHSEVVLPRAKQAVAAAATPALAMA